MHVQSNGGWLGGWLGGRLNPPPPLAGAASQPGSTGTRTMLSAIGGGINQRWYQGIQHCSAFSSSSPSPSIVNGHTLMAAVPTPVPMTHTLPM